MILKSATADSLAILGRLECLWPLTIDQYHRMVETGVVGEDDPLELIDGYLVAKDQGRGHGMGHGPAHAAAMTRLHDLLRQLLGPAWVIRCQLPVTLPDRAETGGGREPEPDFAIVDGPNTRYHDHHPGPAEIRMLLEVADSSLTLDRSVKAPVYAAAGIDQYRIVNLVDRQVETHANPNQETGTYDLMAVKTGPEEVMLAWPGLQQVILKVQDLFGE